MFQRIARRVAASIVVGSLVVAACGRSSPAAPSPPVDHIPAVLGDGWAVSTPEAQGLSPAVIDNAYASAARLSHILSLLVVRNGSLVAEQYFNGWTASSSSSTASVTKSIVSALVGIIHRDGTLPSLDQRMEAFFPEIDWARLDPRKRAITIEHLLQMRSGYPWEERTGQLFTVVRARDRIALVEQLSLTADPGTEFGYSNLGVYLLGVIVSRASGQSLRALAQSTIFDPLRARIAGWPRDELGYDIGYGDAELTARDLAKFGLLYLNRGTYGGTRILPAAWVEASLRAHSFNAYGTPIMTSVGQLDYGYLWWSCTARAHPVAYAWGHGGQIVAIVDDLNMVIVATARPSMTFDEASWTRERAVLELVFGLIGSL